MFFFVARRTDYFYICVGDFSVVFIDDIAVINIQLINDISICEDAGEQGVVGMIVG